MSATFGTVMWGNSSEWFGRQGFWLIEAAPHVAVRLKRIFPRVESKRGKIVIADTPEVARDLSWVLDRWPMELVNGSRERLEQRTEEYTRTEETLLRILQGERYKAKGMRRPARRPRKYQLQASDAALATGRLLVGDDVGLGKSMTGLLCLRAPDSLPALVVTLTHLPTQWLEELALTFPKLRGHIIRGTQVYDPAKTRSMDGHEPDVLVMNYAKLHAWSDHLAGVVRTVIFDEMQELRRDGSLKYAAAAHVADQARYTVGLTATPVYNYGGEMFNVISVLERDALGTHQEFAREWGIGTDGKSIKEPAALGSHLRDQGLFLRRTRKQVGRELPAVSRVAHNVDVDEEVLERLTDEAIDLAQVIVSEQSSNREVFTAAGDFDWRMRRATGISKAPYVAEFVRLLLQSEPKVVLFGWHRAVYEIWLQRLRDLRPVMYTGSESPTAKNRAKAEFLEGDSRLLLMSLRAGAGLDGLQKVSSVAVFGELDWSPGIHDQGIGRLSRDGQPDPVVAYFLVSDHGTDPLMAEVLNVKRMQAEPIRDPDRKLFEPSARPDRDRIRRLAEEVIAARRGVDLVEAA